MSATIQYIWELIINKLGFFSPNTKSWLINQKWIPYVVIGLVLWIFVFR